jgi:GTP-binding protein
LKRVAKTTPFVISAVSGQGVDTVLRALMQFIDKARQDTATPRSADVAWQP